MQAAEYKNAVVIFFKLRDFPLLIVQIFVKVGSLSFMLFF